MSGGQEPASGPHLVVLRLDQDGIGAQDRAATTQGLLAQTYPDWSVLTWPAGEDGRPALPADPVLPTDAQDVLVVSLPEGAVLVPDALDRIARAARPYGARFVSWDLDLVSAAAPATGSAAAGPGEVVPALRFGWSPETLLSADYTHGCFALALPDYLAAAAAVPAGEPLTPWRLLLQLPCELAPTVHLPHPLAAMPAPAPIDDAAAEAVVDGGLRARAVPARCRRRDGVTRLEWAPERWPSVSLLVPTRHNEAMLGPLLESLPRTEGPRFELLVVDNGERTAEHERWYQRDWGFPLRVIWWQEQPFHYGRVNNAAARESTADVLVLLNDDTRVLDPGWLAELVGLATQPMVGCAGMSLLDGAGRLQHAGVWLGLGGFAGHLFGGLQPGTPTLLGPTTWYRNTLAVTAACLAIRRELYLQVGGLDERMVLCGSDVTLGLDLVARGYRNVCSPLPGVAHLESVTRSSAPIGDQRVSLVRYQPWHDAGDPYGNPRLSLRSTTPKLRRRDEADPVAEARARLEVRL